MWPAYDTERRPVMDFDLTRGLNRAPARSRHGAAIQPIAIGGQFVAGLVSSGHDLPDQVRHTSAQACR